MDFHICSVNGNISSHNINLRYHKADIEGRNDSSGGKGKSQLNLYPNFIKSSIAAYNYSFKNTAHGRPHKFLMCAESCTNT